MPAAGRSSAITVLAPDDIWAVGWQSCHFDGTTGRRFRSRPPAEVIPCSTFRPCRANDVWAVGTSVFCDGFDCDFFSYAIHWDGNNWTLTEPPGTSLGGVQALASNNVYAVGTYSLGTVITRWTGRNWKTCPESRSGGGRRLERDHGHARQALGGRIVLTMMISSAHAGRGYSLGHPRHRHRERGSKRRDRVVVWRGQRLHHHRHLRQLRRRRFAGGNLHARCHGGGLRSGGRDSVQSGRGKNGAEESGGRLRFQTAPTRTVVRADPNWISQQKRQAISGLPFPVELLLGVIPAVR